MDYLCGAGSVGNGRGGGGGVRGGASCRERRGAGLVSEAARPSLQRIISHTGPPHVNEARALQAGGEGGEGEERFFYHPSLPLPFFLTLSSSAPYTFLVCPPTFIHSKILCVKLTLMESICSQLDLHVLCWSRNHAGDHSFLYNFGVLMCQDLVLPQGVPNSPNPLSVSE